jgi:hypothetical protein
MIGFESAYRNREDEQISKSLEKVAVLGYD